MGSKAGSNEVSPYAAPARATNLEALPSAYVDVGTLDIFRDEDMAYANRLLCAGVPVEFHLWPGVPHGFEIAVNAEVTRLAIQRRHKAVKSF